MRIAKKFLLVLFVAATFLTFGFIRAKATITGEVTITGGMVRTEDPYGLMFIANTDVEDISECGFLLSKGKYTSSEMQTKFGNGAHDNYKFQCNEPDGAGNFKIAIVNYAGAGDEAAVSAAYEKYVTAVAYIYKGGEYKYSSEAIVINMADAARIYYNRTADPIKYLEDIAEDRRVKVTHSSGSVNYYSSLAGAISASFSAGDTINLLRGTYDNSLTISANNISLTGPNNGVSGVSLSRCSEAELTGLITIDAGISNCSINGLRFSGNARIICNSITPSSINDTNLDGFNFEYNYIYSTIDSSNEGFIFFDTNYSNGDRHYAYNNNLIFNENYFETNSTYAGEKLIHLFDTINVTLTHNTFNNVKKDCLFVDDHGKGLAGDLVVTNNKFNGLGGYAINVDWIAHMAENTYRVTITNNEFLSSVGTSAYINFEQTNKDLRYTEFKIERNVFKGNSRILWYDAKVISSSSFSYNYVEIQGSHRYVVKSDCGATGTAGVDYIQQYKSDDKCPIDCQNNIYVNASSKEIINPPSSSLFNSNIANAYETCYSDLAAFNSASGLNIMN